MNRRPSGSLFLSKAITGFMQYKAAEGLSPTTLRSYEHDLKLWLEYIGGYARQLDQGADGPGLLRVAAHRV